MRMIQVMMILIFATGILAEHPPSQNSPLRSKLMQYLRQQSESGYAYSVLVSIDQDVILQDGFGWIDSSRTKHASRHTLYNIASMTKSFTSILTYALAAQGKLQLGDKITKYFKNVPYDKQSITIQQLLAHTSGLGQHYLADGTTGRDSAVWKILRDTLHSPPGSEFSYSDENYELLGALLEILTGKSYETAIRSFILTKASMGETRFWGEALRPSDPEVASMNRELDPSVRMRNWGYIGSGGIYSNVVDLHSFFKALVAGSLLDTASIREMWTVRVQSKNSGIGIGSGWFISSYRGNCEIWTRGNEDWGHNSVLRWFPDRKILIIVLTNSGERGEAGITANKFISDGIADMILP